MANGKDQEKNEGGGRTYTEEDVMTLMNEAAKRAAAETLKRNQNDGEEDDTVSVINPKVVKQLKDTVAVFTALKELSSNPLQKTIEETVGGMAASVVQNAFAPRGPPPKQDIVDKLLNSQFAYGLGSGLGQRGPELVETMGRTFGSERTGQMIDNMIGKYGQGQQAQSKQLNPVPTSAPTPSTPSESKPDKQSEKELLLSLDPNNPEHVSAYAETQGGLPIEVARKMLMIHQDAFIEQLKKEGMNVDQISSQRGSHTPESPSQAPSQQRPKKDLQYAEYQDVPEQKTPSSEQRHPSIDNSEPAPYPSDINASADSSRDNIPIQNNQEVELMKTFANDIGKVMGDMLNRIEGLNNSVFSLQNEINTMKQVQPISPPTSPISPISPIISGNETEIETFEDPILEEPITSSKVHKPKTSEFFEEHIQDKKEFIKELESETKSSTPSIELQSSFSVDNEIEKEIKNDESIKIKAESENINKDINKDEIAKFVKPITGIHKKADMRKLKPSFKKDNT